LSTNNFHDDFLIKPEEDGSKHHKIMNLSVLVKILGQRQKRR
jgi:hypothetical protein